MANLINTPDERVAQHHALNTTSNNITNYAVTGYSRPDHRAGSGEQYLSGSSGSNGRIPMIIANTISFITSRLRAASAWSSAITTQYGQVSSLDDIFSSTTEIPCRPICRTFSSLQTLSSNAVTPARQAVIGKRRDW